ncbi:MAG: PilZ domain-containing protein [Anaeromyxobacter sp.]
MPAHADARSEVNRMALFPSAGVISLDVQLRPEKLVAAWRSDTRRLVLELPGALRPQQRVAARITALGRGAAVTITGRVASAVRQDRMHRVELVPDETRLLALEHLLAVARGEPIAHQPRAPRLLASFPAVVGSPTGPTYMTTFSVSENGCGLTWSGAPPAKVGAQLDVRLGAGNQAVTFRSVVCWTARTGSTSTVGLRFMEGAKGAWATMLTDAQRSGALPA